MPSSTVDPIGYGKVAIVTGCSSGIGLATTQLLLAHQFSVCGLDANDFKYELLRDEDHGRFHFHKADLTAAGACEDGVNIALFSFGYACPFYPFFFFFFFKKFSFSFSFFLTLNARNSNRVDVLVNVAGIMDKFGSADTIEDEEWDNVLALNLTVPVKMMRAVLPFMKKDDGGGVIINVGSTASVSGAVAGIAYTSSKHGLVSFLYFFIFLFFFWSRGCFPSYVSTLPLTYTIQLTIKLGKTPLKRKKKKKKKPARRHQKRCLAVQERRNPL